MSRALDVDYATATLSAVHQAAWNVPTKPQSGAARMRWRPGMEDDPQAALDHMRAVLGRPTVDFDVVSVGAMGPREAYIFVPIPTGVVPDSEVLDIERGVEVVPIRRETEIRLQNELIYGLVFRAAQRALACNPTLQAVICVGLRSPEEGKGSFLGTDIMLVLGIERVNLERITPLQMTAEEAALAAQDDMRQKIGTDGALMPITPVDAPDFHMILSDIFPDA